MSDIQHEGDSILHQDSVEGVVDDVIEAGVGKDHAAIADLPAASGTYVQAEATATRTALNSVLQVLRDNGMIASS